MKMSRLAMCAALLGCAAAGWADSPVAQWTSGTGANGHYYQRIDVDAAGILTWSQARTAAAARTYNTGTRVLPGRLAVFDVNYYDAFSFVHNSVMYAAGSAALDQHGYWVGASSPTGSGPPATSWTWINGATVPITVLNGWNVDQHEGAGAEGATFFRPASAQLWDYIQTDSSHLIYGYVVEFATACPADLGVQGGTAGQDGLLDNNDFVVFINFFFALDARADHGVQGGSAGHDGLFDNNDFVVFINEFFAGCGA